MGRDNGKKTHGKGKGAKKDNQSKGGGEKPKFVPRYHYFAKSKLASYPNEDGVCVYLEKNHDEKDFFKLKTILKSRTSSNEELCHRPGMGLALEQKRISPIAPVSLFVTSSKALLGHRSIGEFGTTLCLTCKGNAATPHCSAPGPRTSDPFRTTNGSCTSKGSLAENVRTWQGPKPFTWPGSFRSSTKATSAATSPTLADLIALGRGMFSVLQMRTAMSAR